MTNYYDDSSSVVHNIGIGYVLKYIFCRVIKHFATFEIVL